ncbi:MAG: four helix bundle protein [Candidatus Omnitrophica bacterium]|nr:four helix bundle protein [Candidatus Omnitrophota bacterium]MDD5553593.1 four helix bundle protein [Candidatus Omnitrophota bacterium]
MAFDFEKLEVYKKALNLAEKVYKITADFPERERYGLQGQLRRAAVSISSNIAEGSGRYNKKDFAQFLRIARGSLYECIPLIEISLRIGYIDKKTSEELLFDGNELAKMAMV